MIFKKLFQTISVRMVKENEINHRNWHAVYGFPIFSLSLIILQSSHISFWAPKEFLTFLAKLVFHVAKGINSNPPPGFTEHK
jgi:hypothetical protein